MNTEFNIIKIAKKNIKNNWKNIIIEYLETYKNNINNAIKEDLNNNIEVYPKPSNLIFRAFNLCDIKTTKVVIIGLSVYHNNEEQANGLCFSVNNNVKRPPSLTRIFNSLKKDYGIRSNNNLDDWASQGVLLLNRALTVQKNKPLSHYKLWYKFTLDIIKYINKNCNNIVFLLWGAKAQDVIKYLDNSKHCILTARHPSPLARGVFDGKFVECNDYLQKKKKKLIKWV